MGLYFVFRLDLDVVQIIFRPGSEWNWVRLRSGSDCASMGLGSVLDQVYSGFIFVFSDQGSIGFRRG